MSSDQHMHMTCRAMAISDTLLSIVTNSVRGTQVLDELDLSNTEIEQTCRMYEKFLCNMALLRWQREKMMQQVSTTYKLGDEEWLAQVASEQDNIKSFLSASAAIESMYIWLRKETELYCDLITSVCLEVRFCTRNMLHLVHVGHGVIHGYAGRNILLICLARFCPCLSGVR